MTIEVRIENKDATRTVVVESVVHSKGGRPPVTNLERTLKPTEAQSFYVHLLCDLKISEQEPRL